MSGIIRECVVHLLLKENGISYDRGANKSPGIKFRTRKKIFRKSSEASENLGVQNIYNTV